MVAGYENISLCKSTNSIIPNRKWFGILLDKMLVSEGGENAGNLPLSWNIHSQLFYIASNPGGNNRLCGERGGRFAFFVVHVFVSWIREKRKHDFMWNKGK